MAPPRWSLYAQAVWWRSLLAVGMQLHRVPTPRPPSPGFTRTVDNIGSSQETTLVLQFYPPASYSQRPNGKTYPVVVNFHGGGFTMGTATDDSRWADAVVKEVDAVVVSVDYRLAPEYPFPVAVDDGVRTLNYLSKNAEELGLDISRVATSGFSAGANLAFTVPMKYNERKTETSIKDGDAKSDENLEEHQANERCTIVAIVSWYPPVDFRIARELKRTTSRRPDQNLPSFLTQLFDASYLYPEDKIDLSDPYLSPAAASDEILRALPNNIILYTCEWDMLLVEGRDFAHRLQHDIGKNVRFHTIEKVRHGWDKAPNPIDIHPAVKECYAEACTELKTIMSAGELTGVS